jgi:predicted nucleic acid-binding protein
MEGSVMNLTALKAADVNVAGIALAQRATLATRNTPHFEDLAVRVINPWTD